jgi:hypothetical protein
MTQHAKSRPFTLDELRGYLAEIFPQACRPTLDGDRNKVDRPGACRQREKAMRRLTNGATRAG